MTREPLGADHEELRRLAGGVAHDLNNVLAVIRGNSDLLLRGLPAAHPLRGHAESIKRATEWGTVLARQILTTIRTPGVAAEAVDPGWVVESVLCLLRPVLDGAVTVLTRLDPGVGAVALGQGQLGQVVINLVLNARDAMPEGGRLTVEVTAADALPADVSGAAAPSPTGWVVLTVSDTGCGMDEATRARLFQPFFTTKTGKGTGLGLATVHEIVTRAGGAIAVRSAAGQGATLRVYLPRLADGVTGLASAPAADAPTVLVIEEEGQVRELIREILGTRGFAVLEARDPDEARALLEGHPGAIDLVVAELGRPEAVADRLARVAALAPEVPTLYISGYLEDVRSRRGPVLRKPFTVDDLAATVRALLDGTPPAGGAPTGSAAA